MSLLNACQKCPACSIETSMPAESPITMFPTMLNSDGAKKLGLYAAMTTTRHGSAGKHQLCALASITLSNTSKAYTLESRGHCLYVAAALGATVPGLSIALMLPPGVHRACPWLSPTLPRLSSPLQPLAFSLLPQQQLSYLFPCQRATHASGQLLAVRMITSAMQVLDVTA
jgi:hypothetical protein